MSASERWFAQAEKRGTRTDKIIADTWKLIRAEMKLIVEERKEQKEADRIFKKKAERRKTGLGQEGQTFE
jgi:hypothetical protein